MIPKRKSVHLRFFAAPLELFMNVFYSDCFVLPLPAGHRFPMQKYRLLRERVQAELSGIELHEAPPACADELALVHDGQYIDRIVVGKFDAAQEKLIGFPWSPRMVERSRRSVGATVAACRRALDEAVAVNLAGGTHHAYAGHGEGFCVFNDAAVAARVLQRDAGGAPHLFPVAIVDLDVHQGNGTASIFANDSSVFTLSLHGERNYPFRKERSDLDIALPDGCDDSTYLAALDEALAQLFERQQPRLIIYLAGADPHHDDRLGRLALSMAGLARRDALVFDAAATRGIPVAVTMAGGYGRDIDQTVDVHVQTVQLAAAHHRRMNGARPAMG
jgi:acetoin utilization deacetylase AcuC-like enzyme